MCACVTQGLTKKDIIAFKLFAIHPESATMALQQSPWPHVEPFLDAGSGTLRVGDKELTGDDA